MTEQDPGIAALAAVIRAADDWYDDRGGNPAAALRVAIGNYRHAVQQQAGRWYNPATSPVADLLRDAAAWRALASWLGRERAESLRAALGEER